MDWTYNTIWREQLAPGAFAKIEYQGRRPASVETQDAPYVLLHKFKTKQPGLSEVQGVTSAQYLQIDFSNITSFAGVSRLGRIKRMELCWCLKLNTDVGLLEIADHIEWLHIHTSRKFSPSSELCGLKNLKVLCLNACGPIGSLGFLKDMPQLLDFRFVDTPVLDGDLTPLMEHPSLVHAAFDDKRHYNLKSAHVGAALAAQKEQAIEYAYKGEFRTFRYKGLGQSAFGSGPSDG